ncbi:MAG: helix-turn-helix domain-containing protein [Actinobacteria bacterium]|nr:helix-turn-helix domain-containing protein [Actinomycetota bacterium]
MPTMVKIGDSVKRQRQREALTQAELAAKAGIAEVTLSRIERNQADPHMSTIRKLATILNVHPRELVGD